jgi:hypothetical protein
VTLTEPSSYPGSCTITASQAGNGAYLPAPDVPQTFAVNAPAGLIPQTITFAALTDKTFGDPPFTVSATASSGLPVSFAASGNCTVGGTLVTLTGPGSCTITASQAGNGTYAPAPAVPQAFTIAAPPAGPPTLYFSTLWNVSVPTVGGTPDNADIYTWNGTSFSRVIDAAGGGSLGLPSSANVDGFDYVSPTEFYMSFADNTAVPGIGTVQDEDVVHYVSGTWSVFFDGTSHGLTSGGHDLDAINVVGGTLYFSTRGNSAVPGAGSADDADIYSWNGSSYTKVWDATANGLPGGANVDGFVMVDASHFYMSFVAGQTSVPTLGNVQDEDVIYNNGGTWQVFFDGTAAGLTADGQDLDAIDVVAP